MKIKTVDLTGYALDWAVMSCVYPGIAAGTFWPKFVEENGHSTSWQLSGDLLEAEKIDLLYIDNHNPESPPYWQANTQDGKAVARGPTMLVAALRCFVLSILGPEVDVMR